MLRKRLYSGVLLLFSVIVSVGGCEIVLRAISSNEYYVHRPGLKTTTQTLQGVLPGISGKKRFYINSFGLRGDSFSDNQDYRFLAIGGSTTECFYLDESEAWPYLLQETLNQNLEQKIWVGNAGKSSHKTYQHMPQVQLLLKQYPKIDAIILLVGFNDFNQRLGVDNLYTPLPPFNSFNAVMYNNLLVHAFDVRAPSADPRLPFYEKTEIWYRLRKLKWRFMYRESNQDDAGEIVARRRRWRQDAPTIRTSLPDLSSALEEYSRNLNTIIDLAGARHARTIFMTQPTMWRPGLPKELSDLLLFGGVGSSHSESGHEYYSLEALSEGMRMYNETLISVCQARNVECVDLASLLPQDATVFYDDCHFNESGSRGVAKILAEYILSVDQ